MATKIKLPQIDSTLQSGGNFYFKYNDLVNGFGIDDTSGAVFIKAKDDSSYVEASTDLINLLTSSTAITLTNTSYELQIGSSGLFLEDDELSITSDIVTLYSTGATSGSLRFSEIPANGLGYVELKAPDDLSGATFSYTLPSAYPTTSGDVLTSTTAGITSWVSATSLDGIYGHDGTISENRYVTISTGNLFSFKSDDNDNLLLLSEGSGTSRYLQWYVPGAGTISLVNTIGYSIYTDLTISQTASNHVFKYYSTSNNAIIIEDTGPSILLQSDDAQQSILIDDDLLTFIADGIKMEYNSGVLKLYDSDNTNFVGITVPATGSLTSSYTLTLPVDDGTTGQVLTTNGSGTLSWTTVSGGGVSDGDKGDITVSSSGTVWTLDAGVGGIYKGSGTIPDNTVGTLVNNGDFSIAYNAGNNAFRIDDSLSQAFLSGENGIYSIYVDNSTAGLTGALNSTVLLESTGALTLSADVTNTNTANDRLIIQTTTSNTVANGFGGAILFKGESSTTINQDMARISSVWTNVTHANREAKLSFQLGDNGGALTEIANFNTSGASSGQLSIGSTNATTFQNSGITPGTGFTIGGTSNGITLSSSAVAGITINNNTSTAAATISMGLTSIGHSSGTRNEFSYYSNFAPTSGTGVLNTIAFLGTVNQTGGANGIMRRIYDNSTITSIADYRSFQTDINSASAKGFVQTGASTTNNFVGGVTFGSTNTPDASAAIDVVSTSKGVGIPVMTDAQRDAISSPREGLVVYTTDQDALSLRDNGIWKRLPTTRTILKTADETVNNSSTFQADNHLTFTAKANKKYVIRIYLYIEDSDFSAGTGGMQFRITAPSATTVRIGATGGVGVAASAGDAGGFVEVYDAFIGSLTEGHLLLTGYVNPGASDRTVTLEWAQANADVRNSKVLEGSFLEYEEIN